MKCANPECNAPADLSAGVLRLIELDVPPEQRLIRSDGGFPICSVPSRYFWLCPTCASHMKIKRWTHDGITFELRPSDVDQLNTCIQSFSHSRPRHAVGLTRKSA